MLCTIRFNFLIIAVVRKNLSLQRHGSWVHIGFRSHDRAWKCDGCYVSVALCTKFKDVKKDRELKTLKCHSSVEFDLKYIG